MIRTSKLHSMQELLVRWMPPILWMGVIFLFSSWPTLPGPELIWWDFVMKKVAHIAVYSILFYLWQKALNWNKPKTEHRYSLAIAICLLYAISDEWHQGFTPGRTPRAADVLYDSLGVFLGFLKVKGLI